MFLLHVENLAKSSSWTGIDGDHFTRSLKYKNPRESENPITKREGEKRDFVFIFQFFIFLSYSYLLWLMLLKITKSVRKEEIFFLYTRPLRQHEVPFPVPIWHVISSRET